MNTVLEFFRKKGLELTVEPTGEPNTFLVRGEHTPSKFMQLLGCKVIIVEHKIGIFSPELWEASKKLAEKRRI